MPKNPVVDCKSRKKRKICIPVTKPKEKLFCPRTMVRYDRVYNKYTTYWVCRMCLKCLLSEEAVKNHLINCSKKCDLSLITPSLPEKNEDTRYICRYCQKIFSRRAKLNEHLKEHVRSLSSEDSELSDCETVDDL